MSPSARRRNLPGSPPARGRRGGGWKSGGGMRPLPDFHQAKCHGLRYVTPRHSIHNPSHLTPSFPRRRESSTRHSVGWMNPQQTAARVISPSTRRRNLPGSPPARGRRFSPAFLMFRQSAAGYPRRNYSARNAPGDSFDASTIKHKVNTINSVEIAFTSGVTAILIIE